MFRIYIRSPNDYEGESFMEGVQSGDSIPLCLKC